MPTGDRYARPGGLAERLWRMRKAARLTQDQLADAAGWVAHSKVTKIENGRQGIYEDDVRAWANAVGHPEEIPELLDMLNEEQVSHRRYSHQLRRGLAAIQNDLDRMVLGGRRIRNFEVTFVPGLLQTADYARYRAQEAVRRQGFDESEVEATVAARRRRQDALFDSTRTFEFIITEATLRFALCPRQVMLGQITRLLDLAELPNVTLAIIPLDSWDDVLATTPQHGFMVVDDTTYVELQASDDTFPPRETEQYDKDFDSMLAEALRGDDALALLRAAAERLRG